MQVIHKGEKVNGEVCAKCDNGVPFKSYKKTSGDWNKDYVLKYIAMVGESKYSEYVYYRTTEAWGLPYIFLYGK